MHPDIYTPSELSRIVRLSRATIANHVRDGRLLGYKTSPRRGQLRIHKADAERWIATLYGGRQVTLDPERGLVFEETVEAGA